MTIANKRMLVSAAAAGICVLSATATGAERIKADGSSTVFPVTEAMAEEFQKAHGDVHVTVGLSGTGGGFEKFCRGDIDVTGASRPITEDERAACEEEGIDYIELPVALDALTVVVNPENDWAQCMTVEELQTMWEPEAQGKIMNWNQVREEWPDEELVLFGAGADSGTYDYFTQAIVGEEHSSRGDFTPSEDDNVLVQGVSREPNALGFFGLAYYEENKDILKAVAIDAGDGCVKPSVQTAKSGEYQPLTRPLFVYVTKQAAQREPVQEFVEFFLDSKRAAKLVEQVGYVPLPTEAYELAMQTFEDREFGTVFAGGSQVGVGVEELLKMQRVD